MGLSGISSYNNLNSSMDVMSKLLSSVSSSSYSAGNPLMADTMSLIGSSLSKVTISQFGSQINNIYNKLKGIEDPDERQAALSGMRDVLTDLASSGSQANLYSFVTNANSVSETDLEAFQQIFGGGADVSENPSGYVSYRDGSTDTPPTWIDKYGEISNSVISTEFSSAGLSIITSQGSSTEKQDAYDALLDKSSEILNSDLSQSEIDDISQNFFEGLSNMVTASDKLEYISNYDTASTLEELNAEAESTETGTDSEA